MSLNATGSYGEWRIDFKDLKSPVVEIPKEIIDEAKQLMSQDPKSEGEILTVAQRKLQLEETVYTIFWKTAEQYYRT